MLEIKSVLKNGIGCEIGLEKGDKILSFDGFDAVDILDYEFYDAQEFFTIIVLSGGEEVEIEIEKDQTESLGLEFVSDNLDIKTCQNNCVFCFIDQMPKGERNTLYVKDDDYRQSFLYGNYITMTNLSDGDLERIIRLNLSPLYISVQATDETVRKKLLNNRFAGRINAQLKRLNDAGIEFHTQVVLVKGENDGAVLQKTMKDLSEYENCLSLAVVPCGITEHRENLFPIEDIDEEYSKEVINQVSLFNESLGRNFVLCADEFYVRANQNFEKFDFYGDFSQLGNGVGGFALFESEFNEICEKRTYSRTFLIATAVSSYDFICRYAKKVESLVSDVKIFVLPCENTFFGKTVTCAGLLTCQDITCAVKNFNQDYDELVISNVMLKNGEELFIDGETVNTLSQKIGKTVRVIADGGESFFNSLSSDNYLLLVKNGG